jgi:hypothetical protein
MPRHHDSPIFIKFWRAILALSNALATIVIGETGRIGTRNIKKRLSNGGFTLLK